MRLRKFFWLASLTLCAAGCATRHSATEKWVISFADVKLEKNEYIQHVQLNITRGKVVAMNRFLDDWDTQVEWDNPSFQRVILEARHFNSGLADIRQLDGFITLTAEKEDGRFDINAVLATEKTTPPGGDGNIRLDRSRIILSPK